MTTSPAIAWQVLHHMRYETDGKSASWICDECSKEVRVYPDFAIIKRGDPTATHVGSSGGVTITTVAINEIVP